MTSKPTKKQKLDYTRLIDEAWVELVSMVEAGVKGKHLKEQFELVEQLLYEFKQIEL